MKEKVSFNVLSQWILMLLGVLVWTTPAFGQETTVEGQVIDQQTGESLPGVNVVVKGTTTGISTDGEGRYELNVPSLQDTLIFSFVGYQTTEVPINGREQIEVSLQPQAITGEEMVVVGYGTQRRQDVTGSISSVNSDDFNAGVSLAPEQLMQGKVAGVNIVESSGAPGAASEVRIRGSSSISAGNDPLYVIDGVPVQTASTDNYINIAGASSTSPFNSMPSNPLNTLNPSDIESIDILKDASATAIYGSRGANGVIMITTKNYSETTVSYNGYVNVSTLPSQLPFLSHDQYVGYAENNGLEYPDEGAETRWQDQVFRNSVSQNHNISFGGTSDNTNYRASVGYNNQEGIALASNLEKYTGRINLTQRAMDDKLQINLNLMAARVDQNNAAISSNIGNEGGNLLKDALRWSPTLPVYNNDGSYYQIGELRVNPVSWQQLEDVTERNTLLGDVKLTYDLMETLSVSVNLGHNREDLNRYSFVPASHPVGASENGRASINKVQNESNLIETTVNYVNDISENSYINFLAGYSFQRFVVNSTFTQANDFSSDAVKWNLIQSGSTLVNTSGKSANRLASVYGRLNYRLMDRYNFTFTLRRDGSSRFGPNNRWGLFPSSAVAWNITEEDFFNVDAINNLKFRLGYGVTGNQEIPNNLFMEQLSIAGSSTYSLGGQAVPSVLPSNYANPDLKWERTTQTNVGLDFGLWQGRLSGSVDYYMKKTTDLLLSFSTAAPSVVNTQWANVGEVENKGLEVSLNADIIQSGDLIWNSSVNWSTNENEVISLSNEQYERDYFRTGPLSGVVSSSNGYTQIIKPGLPLNTFWGRKYTGLDENGQETYLDEDGDGSADLVKIGDPNPDFTYGWTNSVRWRRFDASVTMRGTIGNDVFNNTAAEFSYTNLLPGSNVLETALERQQNGLSPEQTAQFSSQWLEDGSYLRLANLTLGYNFDTSSLPLVSKARLYATGQNLFVITGYSGFDPEVQTNTNTGGSAPVGIDYLAYPRPRVFQLGVNLSF
ncbi:SusC/RagA family TonB-linked outer membrane protein [Fodinibius salsisoli]|uniref:TonB-dependent receptor n=1 Tax=Fodinibius salsisoli TaxID=2820877 RepID=A0ABT3PHA9_9BACT|nr:TonB-dependent receptor [Fodinibius salsisoli]MCW9705303.1 TonB-dependent receptor [Fodinibius salsisoli]